MTSFVYLESPDGRKRKAVNADYIYMIEPIDDKSCSVFIDDGSGVPFVHNTNLGVLTEQIQEYT